MTTKILKIVILSIGVIAVGTIIGLTYKPVYTFSDQQIKPFNFNQYIKQRIDTALNGKTYKQTKQNYIQIYDIITTEASIISNRGQLLSTEDATTCYKNAFDAYWTIYNDELNSCFASDWSYERQRIRDELSLLKNKKGCTQEPEIDKYLSYLEGYKLADGIISSASRCQGSETYDNICNKKKEYFDVYPYKNIPNLQKKLKDVQNTAKSSWREYIIGEMKTLLEDNSYYDDPDVTRYNLELNSLRKETIQPYTNKFGDKDEELNKLNTRLSEKLMYLVQP